MWSLLGRCVGSCCAAKCPELKYKPTLSGHCCSGANDSKRTLKYFSELDGDRELSLYKRIAAGRASPIKFASGDDFARS
jgi:hypothetical protein